ncbi:MAG: AAA family ATPase [Myxococcota bacterium]
MTTPELTVEETEQKVAELAPLIERTRAEMGRVLVGQRYLVDRLLIGLLCDGHVLLEGVPGLAKTTAVKALAGCLALRFSRIQFTPDLLPADVVGTQVYQPKDGEFTTRVGPVFANLVLADEINRAPPKVQSALLEAMQERQVTIGDRTYDLPRPFLVLATQNPIEQEGTYPLPEAQQDRFMLSVPVGYPSFEEEEEIVRRTTVGEMRHAERVISGEELVAYQRLLRRLPANPDVVRYCVQLSAATRPGSGLDATRWIRWGAGPRASQFLAVGARTWAALRGNEVPTREDVRAIAPAVLRHRILLNFEAEAAGVDVDRVVGAILEEVG